MEASKAAAEAYSQEVDAGHRVADEDGVDPTSRTTPRPDDRGENTIFSPVYRRQQDDERFAMTPEEYLRRYHITDYLGDALKLLVDTNDKNPLDFLAAYFSNVLSGDNVLFRSFSYIRATTRNRRSFIRQLQETHQNFDPQGKITVLGLHQLICLLCPDFPLDIVEAASQTFPSSPDEVNSAVPEDGHPFQELSLRTYLTFFFAEFLGEAARAFKALDEGGTGRIDTGSLTVELTKILHTSNQTFSCPGQEVLTHSFSNLESTTSFEEFCNSLFQNGRLPRALLQPRTYAEVRLGIDKLLETLDMTGDPLISRSKKKKSRRSMKL